MHLLVLDILTDGTDFVTSTRTITFPAGSQSQCIDFAIVNDATEELEESFTACIDSASPPGVDITSGNPTTTVVIVDDDSKSIVDFPNLNSVLTSCLAQAAYCL